MLHTSRKTAWSAFVRIRNTKTLESRSGERVCQDCRHWMDKASRLGHDPAILLRIYAHAAVEDQERGIARLTAALAQAKESQEAVAGSAEKRPLCNNPCNGGADEADASLAKNNPGREHAHHGLGCSGTCAIGRYTYAIGTLGTSFRGLGTQISSTSPRSEVRICSRAA